MKIKVVAAIVDTRQLTLYKEDGETIVIQQGDPRVKKIVEEVTPLIIKQGWAEVDVTSENVYHEFEKKSGVVKFFKVAREKLAKLFHSDEPTVSEGAVGKIPVEQAIAEIMANAEPVSSPTFNTNQIAKQGNVVESNGMTDNQRNEKKTSHTIVASVNGKIIPDMEKIETQFMRATKLGSTKAIENFLKRLGAVINERSHSVEDLLKFLERGDLPIAEDGSIIIYKILNKRGDKFYDVYSGNVPQKVGSYVCMDISLVDRNRNQECSNGLHVARRGYLGSFNGSACVIAKLAPEDVVTVPLYDANKMRVMGYHILYELPDELYRMLKQNKPITDTQFGATLLGNIIAGNHIRVTEVVTIGGPKGTKITVTENIRDRHDTLLEQKVTKPAKKEKAKPKLKKKFKAEAIGNNKQEAAAPMINPKDVIQKIESLSRKEQAQKLLKAFQKNPTQKNLDKITDYKKKVKIGWDKLGIDPEQLKL